MSLRPNHSRTRLPGLNNLVAVDGLGDIFYRLWADGQECQVKLSLHRPEYRLRDAYTPGIGQALDACGHVDPVSENITLIFNDVTEVYPYPELHGIGTATVIAQFEVQLTQVILDRCRTAHCIEYGIEHGQNRVSGKVDYLAVMGLHGGGKQLEGILEMQMGGIFINACQPTVPRDICMQNRCKSSW